MDPASLYEALWRPAREGFAHGRFELDPHIDDPSDSRRGVSLVLRPAGAALAGLAAVTAALREVAGEQYFPAPAELHVTVLPVISCAPGFDVGAIETDRLAALVADCTADVDAFELALDGLTASPSCVMARGFVPEHTLEPLRGRLRDAIAASSLPHSMERRYTARTAHVTLMRFRRAPLAPGELVTRLDALRERPIGTCTVDTITLVSNDWYHRRAHVTDLARLPLGRRAADRTGR